MESYQIQKTVMNGGRRTSVRLEPEMWGLLKEIASIEGCRINDLITLIGFKKKPQASLTSAIRVFISFYYKAAATAEGHIKADHGKAYRITNSVFDAAYKDNVRTFNRR